MNMTYLKLFFVLMILFPAASAAPIEKSFLLGLNYVNGTLEKDVIYVTGAAPYEEPGDYTLKIVSANNQVLHQQSFGFTSLYEYKEVLVPYFDDAGAIEIYNPENEKILEVPIAYMGDTCDNRACEGHESFESCPADCPSGGNDDFCDSVSDGRCDPDCGAVGVDADCATAEKSGGGSAGGFSSNMRMFVILGGVILTVAAAVVLFARLRNRGEAELP